MFGDDAPDKFCLAFCQSIEGDKNGRLFVVADAYLCLAIAFEYVNMWRLMVIRPNDELKAVDENDGGMRRIVPVRLGYSIGIQ